MDPRRATPLRLLRGALLGLSSAALAVSAHAMAGGGIPDTAVTVVLVLLVGWAGTTIAERPHSTISTLALLAGSQLGLHFLLTETHAGHESAAIDGRLMIAAHLIATLFTAVLLTRASSALAAVAIVLRGLVRALIHTLIARQAPSKAVPVIAEPGHLLTVLLRQICGRRGPPLFS